MALANGALAAPATASLTPYAAVQSRLAVGWNSWDTNTVTGQVLLPYGLQIRLGVRKLSSENSDAFLPTALIGRKGIDDEKVFPGPHAYDGDYSELRLSWLGVDLKLQTAQVGDDLVMLITPLSAPVSAQGQGGSAATGKRTTFLTPQEKTSQPALAVLSAALLWNRPGSVALDGGRIVARLPDREISIYSVGETVADPQIPVAGPYFAFRLDHPCAISTGKPRTLDQVTKAIAQAQARLTAQDGSDGSAAQVRSAIETVLAWDTIYDPAGGRVISPVSRIWNQN